MTFRLTLTAAVISMVAGVVSADMMTYDGAGMVDSVRLHVAGSPANNRMVDVGQMLVTYQDVQYVGYCVDVYQWAGSADMTERSVDSLHNGQWVSYLFDTYAGQVSSGEEAAALQVAIWEVINENSKHFDVGKGSFHIRQNDDVERLANRMLDGLPKSYDGSLGNIVLYSRGAQDVLIYRAEITPEPSAMALLGLGAAGLMYRRRLT